MKTIQHLVEEFLLHMGNRDLNPLIQLFDDQVDWYIPGDESRISWLGTRQHKSEIRVFFETLWANTLPLSTTLDGVFTQGADAVIAAEFSVQMLPTGCILTSPVFIMLTINSQGKIIKYRLLEDSFIVSESMKS